MLRRCTRSLHGLFLVAGLCVLAGQAEAQETRMVVTPFEEAGFVPIDPARPAGPQIAVLWGDPATGPSAMYLKLAKGSIPLHSHSSDYHLVVLQGEMKHWAGGEREEEAKVLKAGSYWFQPGGQVHGDSCLTDECLMFITWKDKRDGALAGAPR